MAQRQTARVPGWVWAGTAVIACLAIYMGLRLHQDAVGVRAAQVTEGDITSTVSTNGKVEPTDDFQAHAQAPGTVKDLMVELGDKVTKGEELIRMDDVDARKAVAEAQAGLDSATATLHAMEHGGTPEQLLSSSGDLSQAQTQERNDASSLQALQALEAKGAASASEVEAAQQRLSATHARIQQLKSQRTGRYSSDDLAAQRAQVAQARASLSAAQSALAGVDVRSPMNGTVYAIPVAEYDYVQTGETLIAVADLNKLQVRAYFDEPEIGKLAAGQPVKIVWDAKPNTVWHGHILEAPTTIVEYQTTRNVGICLITVDDAAGDLLPNTNVTVTVTTQSREHVLSLPREALHTSGTSNFVFRIENGHLVKTPVQVGVVNLTRVEILHGLSLGQTVALGATSDEDLSDGMSVKVER